MSFHEMESPQARKPRKRHLEEEDDDDECDLPPNKRQKRLQKNRESAARSREKKARLFKEMQVQVSELTEKNNQLTRTLALLTHQCESMNTIRDENRDLRDKLHKLELQIARTEMENQNLRTQCGGSASSRVSSPPTSNNQAQNDTPPTVTTNVSDEDGAQRAAVPLPPITTASAAALTAMPKYTLGSMPPMPETNQAPTPPVPPTSFENVEERHVEELTQLLLHNRPQNGLCTTSVPSCLPVHLYTCANTNNSMKAPPKYYNPSAQLPTADCLPPRGQFGSFNTSLLQPSNGLVPPSGQPSNPAPPFPWQEYQ